MTFGQVSLNTGIWGKNSQQFGLNPLMTGFNSNPWDSLFSPNFMYNNNNIDFMIGFNSLLLQTLQISGSTFAQPMPKITSRKSAMEFVDAKPKVAVADKTDFTPTNKPITKIKDIKLDIRIQQMSEKLGLEASDLKAVIFAESSGNAVAVNKHTNATGLIQIMPDTAKSLGTSVDKIKKMSAEEQLAEGGIVERYLTNAKKIAGFKQGDKLSSGQVYSLVFMPAKAKKTILTSGGKSYDWNKGLDKDNDGKITMQDLDNHINNIKTKHNLT